MRTDVAPAGAVKPVTVGCSVLIAFFRSALSLALLVGCRAMGLSLSSLFTSLSSLVRWSKDQDVRILMLGLDAAGKVRCLSILFTPSSTGRLTIFTCPLDNYFVPSTGDERTSFRVDSRLTVVLP